MKLWLDSRLSLEVSLRCNVRIALRLAMLLSCDNADKVVIFTIKWCKAIIFFCIENFKAVSESIIPPPP
ncbi:hypothetical protein [Helicobacter cinaedi]|uniref:hypothetical protein n=1 Tax=Helicobacter cinaedi TaxID=213 RepID=UPI001E39855C|nr:hypothetical protein [Helicobacter cinaedi]